MKHALVRYHELHLKSEPVRRQMLKQLKSNIMRTTGKKVRIVDGRVIVEDSSKKTMQALQRTFGIASFSTMLVVEKDMKSIEKAASQLMKGFSMNKSFKIEAVRADKTFSHTSQQIKTQIGEVFFNKGYKVRMHNPDKTITIEIRDRAYVYDNVFEGPGGMPLNTAGYFSSQLRSNKDMLAIWLMMKRGATPLLYGKVNISLQKKLEKWMSSRRLKVIDKIKTEAAVTSETDINKLNKLPKETFAPLVGYNESQLKKMISSIN